MEDVFPYDRCQDLRIHVDVPYGECPLMGVVFKGRCNPTGSVPKWEVHLSPIWDVFPYRKCPLMGEVCERYQDLTIDIPCRDSPFMRVDFNGRYHPTGGKCTCPLYEMCSLMESVPLWGRCPFMSSVPL